MKRAERNLLNALRRDVTENTIRCEIPCSCSLEGKQAIHEMLTIEKGMIATAIYWNPVKDELCINYTPAIKGYDDVTRQRQENGRIDVIESKLPRHEGIAWTGHRKPQEAQEAQEAPQQPQEAQESEEAKLAREEEEEEKEKEAKRGYYNKVTLQKFTEAYRSACEKVRAGEDLRVRISPNNSKMGNVASVSMLPFLSCPGICASTCGTICYAAKLANLRPAVLASYAINQAIAVLRPDLYWQQVRAAIAVSRFFRFHVSGDILSASYFAEMVKAAQDFPACEILAFTKKWETVNAWIDSNGNLPRNLHILFSGWETLSPVNPHQLPETNVYGKKEEPDPSWLLCGGNCAECGCRGLGCWQAKTGDVIAFRKH